MSSLSLLGVQVDPVTIDQLISFIDTRIRCNGKSVIGHHNLHSIYLYHRDLKMQAFYNITKVTFVDGMSLIYWARLLGCPVTREQRITSVDWVHPLLATAAHQGWRVFYLGGKPGVAARAAECLRTRYPSLMIATHHGYFRSDENVAILAIIADFQPHILMVGMGMPRQEHWILDNLDRIRANAILSVGACFDYIAGEIPTPPRWMGRVGLEWLYRLISDPRRLSHRYLVEPWGLVPLMIRDIQTRFWRQNRM